MMETQKIAVGNVFTVVASHQPSTLDLHTDIPMDGPCFQAAARLEDFLFDPN
jgi:hypothetical protein